MCVGSSTVRAFLVLWFEFSYLMDEFFSPVMAKSLNVLHVNAWMSCSTEMMLSMVTF